MPIVNLKALNNFVAYSHFKMKGLDAVKQLLEPGDFVTKIDLKDAYLFIPVLKEHKHFSVFVGGITNSNLLASPSDCRPHQGYSLRL
jgi:hypothetical protein